jgi:hypothetical protein
MISAKTSHHWHLVIEINGAKTTYTVQKEQGVRLVSLMQREIILFMASAICVPSYLADFYLLSKFVSLE